MIFTRSVTSTDSFKENFRPLLDPYWAISQPITPSDQIAHQTVTISRYNGLSPNYLRILRTPNTTVLFINIPTVRKMCFIAEENFVRKITKR